MSKHIAQIKAALTAQHAVHGLFADVLEDLENESIRETGQGFLKNWAKDNPSRFITLFVKMTPNLMPQQGVQGEVNIKINGGLVPTDLDAVTLDEQGRVVMVGHDD
jgi:hypothetical protein